MIWRSILSRYPTIMFNNFFYSRKQLFAQMSTIVFFVNCDTIVIYKKGLVTPYHEIPVNTMNFFYIFLVKQRKFSSGISDFFPLSYTHFFFYLGFLSRTFTIHRTAGEGGGHSINSSSLLLPASQTLGKEPVRVFPLFQVHSLICGVFKRVNCLRFLFSLFSVLKTWFILNHVFYPLNQFL